MSNARKKYPNRLWLHRMMLGFTQVEVAKQLGVKRTSMISRWEIGTQLPSVENILKLSILYKTLVNELYHELLKEYQLELFPEEKKFKRNKGADP